MTPRRKRSALCGTRKGYERHLQQRERPCGKCLIGSTTYTDIEIARQIEDFQQKRHDHRLWHTHRILRVTFEQIFDEQGRRCGCCESSDPKQGWLGDLDSDGALRGVLCSDCDLGIEKLGDTRDGIARAAAYLQRHTDREGYDPHYGPLSLVVNPDLSECMKRCFMHFDEGLSVNKVVIREKLPPAAVKEIRTLWLKSRDNQQGSPAKNLTRDSQEAVV